MENDQILKRLEWLDEERRKDKAQIADLESRLNTLAQNVSGQPKQINSLANELNQIPVIMSRLDKFDGVIAQTKVEFAKLIEMAEKRREDYNRELEKSRRNDIEVINRSINELKRVGDPVPDLKKSIQARVDEDLKLARMIDDVRGLILQNQRSEEEFKRSQRMMDDIQRQDSKRLTDLQSEVGALRKRLDEFRGKLEITGDSIRKVELRSNEVYAAEAERRQAQNAFIEKQNVLMVEQERAWQEWADHFEGIDRQSQEIDAQLAAMAETTKSLKIAQESFEDVTERFERRVNEITEMQRLVEERFRQEWVTYKADDQKKWTNLVLNQEDLHRENTRQMEKQSDRLAVLEDDLVQLNDLIKQVVDENLKNLNLISPVVEQWLASARRHTDHYRK